LKIEVEVCTLPIGDVAIGDLFVIERKRSDDLLASLLDGRLVSQARRMMASAPRPLLIVEGSTATTRAVHSNAIAGMMAMIVAEIGLSIVPTRDTKGSARLIAMLAKRNQKELRRQEKLLAQRLCFSEQERIENEPLSTWTRFQASGSAGPAVSIADTEKKAQRSLVRKREKFLTSLPGLGPIRARRLIDKFGTPLKVMLARPEQLVAAGISAESVARIQTLVGRPQHSTNGTVNQAMSSDNEVVENSI
jgi:ERCC4-type nuclease